MYKFEGSKYKEGFKPITEIAKEVKTIINSTFKGVKVGVTSEKFSMGRAIRIGIKKLPFAEHIYDSVTHYVEDSKEIKELKAKIQKVADQWNYIDSDVQSDYYNCSYYATVRVEPDAEFGKEAKLEPHQYAILKDKSSRKAGDYEIQLLDWNGNTIDILTKGTDEGVDARLSRNGELVWEGLIEGKKWGIELIQHLISILEGDA